MYKRILVPMDGSETAKAGLSEACKLARELGAQVRVVHVVDEWLSAPELYGTAYDQITDSIRKAGASLLAQIKTAASKQGVTVETELCEAMGTPAGELIIKTAQEWPADLIVCGTHGRRGLRRIAMGSDAEYIVRSAPVPVLLIRKDDKG